MLESKLKLPPGARGKDLDKYLDRVYEYNKEIIDALDEEGLFGTYRLGKIAFKEEVKAYMEYTGVDVGEAIKTYGRTEDFVSREERRVSNAIDALRKDQNAYKMFRRAWGWNKKITWEDFHATEYNDVYVIGNVMISFEKSPLEIIITVM